MNINDFRFPRRCLVVAGCILGALLAAPPAGAETQAKVVTYPVPAGLAAYGIPASPDYAVAANGRPVFAYTATVCRVADEGAVEETTASFAPFDFSGEVTVTIHAQADVRSVVIRPLSARIVPTIKGRDVTFSLTKPRNLMIEFNGSADIGANGTTKRPSAPEKPLFLFANPLVTAAPKPNAPGVTYFGPGIHHVGHLEVKSGQTLYLAGGAVLDGTPFAEGASNIKILGRGILDGSHTEYKKYLGIDLHNCTDVTIDGITIRASPHWTVVPTGCRNVSINNIKVMNHLTNGDGIDPCNCQHVAIRNCFIYSSDDCISPKGCTWWHQDTLNKPLEDLTVSDSLLISGRAGAAVRIGDETRAPALRDLTFKNLDVYLAGPAFAVFVVDRALVSNVTFEDSRVERYDGYVADIFIDGNGEFSADKPLGKLGSIDGVLFKNISVGTIYGEGGSQIYGSDAAHQVKNITFENVTISGKPLLNIDQQPGRLYPLARPLPFVSNVQFKQTKEKR